MRNEFQKRFLNLDNFLGATIKKQRKAGFLFFTEAMQLRLGLDEQFGCVAAFYNNVTILSPFAVGCCN